MPAEPTRETIDVERLSLYLKSLAHPNRLELLWTLRHPTSAADIRLTPKRRDEALSPARAISRQSVAEHLESLEEIGVVEQVTGGDGRAPLRVINQARLFAIAEELRALTALRPTVSVDVDATLPHADASRPAWPPGPKLVLVGGPWEGRVFPLDGEGPWRVGRSRERDVSLSYDPFVSADHALVAREGAAFVVSASAAARNPCRVNFVPLRAGERRRLAPGDVIGLGRSFLVLQPA